MNKKWILALIMALVMLTMSVAVVAEETEEATPTPPPSIDIDDVTPTPAPSTDTPSSNTGTGNTTTGNKTSSVLPPVITVTPTVAEIAKPENVAVTSSNASVSVVPTVPTAEQTETESKIETALATGTGLSGVFSVSVVDELTVFFGGSMTGVKVAASASLYISGDEATEATIAVGDVTMAVGEKAIAVVTTADGTSYVVSATYEGANSFSLDLPEEVVKASKAGGVLITILTK